MENMTAVDIPKWITITQVAQMTGLSAKTIARWEKIGRIRRAKRNWRGWRIYEKEDILQIKNFLESVF
jgi:DNA-binding transcriptional MerR regulator